MSKMMSSFTKISFVVALGLMIFAVSPAKADTPQLISTHGDWSAFTFMENGNKVCFMASQPKKAQGNYKKRGEIFSLITHRPADNSRDVISFVAGYTYKASSDVTVSIGSKKYTLFTQGDTAWTPDDATDKKMSDAIKNGSGMVVKGRSTRGTLTTDTYSLKGSTAAYDAITKACGL